MNSYLYDSETAGYFGFLSLHAGLSQGFSEPFLMINPKCQYVNQSTRLVWLGLPDWYGFSLTQTINSYYLIFSTHYVIYVLKVFLCWSVQNLLITCINAGSILYFITQQLHFTWREAAEAVSDSQQK